MWKQGRRSSSSSFFTGRMPAGHVPVFEYLGVHSQALQPTAVTHCTFGVKLASRGRHISPLLVQGWDVAPKNCKFYAISDYKMFFCVVVYFVVDAYLLLLC